MNNILQFKTLNNNKEIDVYNNINLDVSLSFNNLTYTLLHENNQNIINNSILFNLEDTNTLYNIFINNSYQYSYQLNNIIFIDNEKNMHVLNYNLFSKNNFNIKNNNIELNILDNKNIQNIYSYNYENFSYIYSDDKNLSKLSNIKTGLYKFSDNFTLNDNNKVSLNISKYNYNDNDINNLVKNYSYILNYYNSNIKLFPQTTKYKKIYYYNNLNLLPNTESIYNNFQIYYSDNNVSYSIDTNIDNTKLDNSLFNINKYLYKIPIINGDHFIIDIPIIYEYETFVNKEFDFMNELYEVDLDKFKINIILSSIETTNINHYIKFDKSKSYVYDYKPIDIDINNSNKIYNFNKIRISLRVCLYFDVNKKVYDIIYKNTYAYDLNKFNKHRTYQNNIFSNLFNIKIQYLNTINYNISMFIDGSGNMFKKIYHNYNYGFNFDEHGDCIGLLLFPYKNYKYKDDKRHKLLAPRVNAENSIENNYTNNVNLLMNKKDIFINFDEESIDNIFVKNNISNRFINYNLPNFNKVINHTLSVFGDNSLETPKLSINYYKTTQIDEILKSKFIYKTNKLSCGNINYLYYPDVYQRKYYDEINNINGLNLDRYSFYDSYGNYDEYDYQYHPYVFSKKEITWTYEFSNNTYEYKPLYNDSYMLMNTYIPEDNSNYVNNMYIVTDNITFTDSKDYSFGKLQIINMNYNNAVNNYYFMDHNIHNDIFDNIYNYRKSGLQFGDFYTPSIQNYLMLYKFNIINLLNENIYNDYNNSTYYLSSCQFYKNVNMPNIRNQYIVDKDFNILYTEDNNESMYIWPFFSIPDYSIINSDDYYVIFDEKDNCDYVDYYTSINKNYININIKYYKHDSIDDLNLMSNNSKFKIDESYTFADIDNNIISLKINIYSIRLLQKNNTFIIYYKDSEDYLNNYKINNNYYRILCKISLKIEDN